VWKIQESKCKNFTNNIVGTTHSGTFSELHGEEVCTTVPSMTFQLDASLCPHWIEAYVLRLQEKSLNDDPGNDKFVLESHFFLVKGLDF
jgi:hypothetical protein